MEANKKTDKTENSGLEAVSPKKFKHTGLAARKDGTIPVSLGGQKFDLAKASQTELKWLYENGCPFVTAE